MSKAGLFAGVVGSAPADNAPTDKQKGYHFMQWDTGVAIPGADFIMEFEYGASEYNLTIPCQNVGVFNAVIDYGDGTPTKTITSYNDANLSHAYANDNSTYQVTITGQFPNIYFNNSGSINVAMTRKNLTKIISWGSVGFTTMSGAFYGCTSLAEIPTTGSNTALVTSLRRAFRSTNIPIMDLTDFDTSNVTDMSEMCTNTWSTDTIDISGWDTTKVTDMSGLFAGTNVTSLNLTGVTTASVTNMWQMFYNAYLLTSVNVSAFDTSNVTNMGGMFAIMTELLTLDVTNFNTAKVTDMEEMFNWIEKVTTLDLSNFDTSKVTTMASMFRDCESMITLDVTSFNTTLVTDMEYMFGDNQATTGWDLTSFNTANVTSMSNMFRDNLALVSIDLSTFDTGKVTNMSSMFTGSTLLESVDTTGWDTSKVTTMNRMYFNCPALDITGSNNLSIPLVANAQYFMGGTTAILTAEYDKILLAYDSQTVQPNLTWDFNTTNYSAGAATTARSSLISGDNWTLNDGGQA